MRGLVGALAVSVGLGFVLAGCGGNKPTSVQPSGQSIANNAQALEVTFRMLTGSDDAAMVDYDAIVQGGKVRLKTVGYPDASGANPFTPVVLTYDGTRLLVHDEGNSTPYLVYENAAHAKSIGGGEPALARVSGFLPFDESTQYSQWLCAKARHVKDGVDLGRPAVKYSCAATTGGLAEVWIDKAFGIALSPLVPADAKFVVNPPIDAGTFSTAPPAGVKSEVIGSGAKTGDKAPAFTITEVPPFVSADKSAPGKPISSTELAGHPYVLAFFDESFLFGGDDGAVTSLRDLSDLSTGGTKPAALAVLLTASNFVDKGGIFASKGWKFRVAYDDSRVQHLFGVSDRLDFVFVNGDDTISAVRPGVMTKAELQAALGRLK